MNAHDSSISRPSRIDWGRAEFVLVGLGFLGFLALAIQVTTIYGGLPAHPLFVHVPVVLVPLTTIAGIACMAKPEWLRRYGIALSVVSIVTMSSVFLSLQAGDALRGTLDLRGEAANLISEHSEASHVLAIAYTLFTAALIVSFASLRISGGRPTGFTLVDRLLSPPAVFAVLRASVVILALVAAFFTYRTGDLGAKAVWAHKMQAAERRESGDSGG
jgi:hypothetical protein